MPVGGTSLDSVGVPLPDETLEWPTQSDAVLLGAIGGYKWDNNPKHLKPETGLLQLRHGLGVLANMRPATVLRQLVDASTLKEKLAEGVDLMVSRELTGGEFDTILTKNIFGDILSDEASILTGSIGMLPSASFGATTLVGCRALGEEVQKLPAFQSPVLFPPKITEGGNWRRFSLCLLWPSSFPSKLLNLRKVFSEDITGGFKFKDFSKAVPGRAIFLPLLPTLNRTDDCGDGKSSSHKRRRLSAVWGFNRSPLLPSRESRTPTPKKPIFVFPSRSRRSRRLHLAARPVFSSHFSVPQATATVHSNHVSPSSSRPTVTDGLTVTVSPIFHFVSARVLPILVNSLPPFKLQGFSFLPFCVARHVWELLGICVVKCTTMITGGKIFVTSPPAFSNDSKKLLVCTGNTVSIFSTSTGMLITELEGHTELVTSVIVPPAASAASKILCYCWTASFDGTICYWDFSLPDLIKKVEVKLPIHSMVIPVASSQPVQSTEKPSNLYAFVSLEDTSRPKGPKVLRGIIRMVDLTNSRLSGTLLAETKNPEPLIARNSGEFVGVRNKQHLRIWRVPCGNFTFDEIKAIKLHHTKKLMTLAFHPTERIVAGGDASGRILIWRGIGHRKFSQNQQSVSEGKVKFGEERPGVRDDDDADSCTTWHWHPSEKIMEVSGKEGVLVVWQLDTGKKKFLPRLGSPLLYFTQSSDPSLVSRPFSFPKVHGDLYSGYVFDHSSGLVALRTEAYRIQFYSLFDDREVSQVQVCECNYQPVDDVTHIALFQ
ncbi:hypothetical protein ACLOJK_021660 [Asimina triloba]